MGGENADASYFISLGGVTWKIIFFIVFLVAFIAVALVNWTTYKKVKVAILKEDYGITGRNGEIPQE